MDEEEKNEPESLLLDLTREFMQRSKKKEKPLGQLCLRLIKLFIRKNKEMTMKQAAIMMSSLANTNTKNNKIQAKVLIQLVNINYR